jgi:hypothetical protein
VIRITVLAFGADVDLGSWPGGAIVNKPGNISLTRRSIWPEVSTYAGHRGLLIDPHQNIFTASVRDCAFPSPGQAAPTAFSSASASNAVAQFGGCAGSTRRQGGRCRLLFATQGFQIFRCDFLSLPTLVFFRIVESLPTLRRQDPGQRRATGPRAFRASGLWRRSTATCCRP